MQLRKHDFHLITCYKNTRNKSTKKKQKNKIEVDQLKSNSNISFREILDGIALFQS